MQDINGASASIFIAGSNTVSWLRYLMPDCMLISRLLPPLLLLFSTCSAILGCIKKLVKSWTELLGRIVCQPWRIVTIQNWDTWITLWKKPLDGDRYLQSVCSWQIRLKCLAQDYSRNSSQISQRRCLRRNVYSKRNLRLLQCLCDESWCFNLQECRRLLPGAIHSWIREWRWRTFPGKYLSLPSIWVGILRHMSTPLLFSLQNLELITDLFNLQQGPFGFGRRRVLSTNDLSFAKPFQEFVLAAT